jgi:hypothetical protein
VHAFGAAPAGTGSSLAQTSKEAIMNHGSAVIRSSSGRNALLFALLATVLLLAPHALAGATSNPGTNWRECVDNSFADYNSCLMESSNWFHQKLCDLAFEGDVVWCTAKYIGEVKSAYDPA